MEKENTHGLMVESIRGNGKIICCMAGVLTLGQTVGNMMENTKTTKKMEKVFTHGLMARAIMVGGKTANNTVKQSLLIPKDKAKRVSGRMVIE